MTDVTEIAYNKGYKAFAEGKYLTDNPYSVYTNGVEFVSWRAGWYDHEQMSKEDGPIFNWAEYSEDN
jgi:hypothetical protein